MKARKPDKRATWMSAFEAGCRAVGIPYRTMHEASAAYYYTAGVPVNEAVRRFKEGFDDKIADNLLDAIDMKEDAQ